MTSLDPLPARASVGLGHSIQNGRWLEARDLLAFVTIAETRSVSEAARILFLSQPAVSRRLLSLERTVGAALIRRSSRRATLAPLGEAVLPIARGVLSAHDEAQLSVDALRRSACSGIPDARHPTNVSVAGQRPVVDHEVGGSLSAGRVR